MKANELRLGNYVIEDKKISRITGIDDETRISTDLGFFPYTFIEEINPVPLTEEWLEKFGFEKIGTNYQYKWFLLHGNNKTGTVDFLLNEPYSGKYNATVLKHVHQLQNLFWCLTGQELTIK